MNNPILQTLKNVFSGKYPDPRRSIRTPDTPTLPIAVPSKDVAITDAERDFASIADIPFSDNEAIVFERLQAILNTVESRDYSPNSDTLRPLLYDIENPTAGGIYIEGEVSYSWNWKYTSSKDEKQDTRTHMISLTNGMGEDKVKVMDMEVKTTLSGRIKSLNAKYHIDCSSVKVEFVRTRAELRKNDNIGTRCVDMDFTDGSKVIFSDRDYFLDLLTTSKYYSPEELDEFFITGIGPCSLVANPNKNKH